MNGNQLRQERKARSLSQKDLGDLTGISQGRISQIEGGSRSCNPGELEKFLKVFKDPPPRPDEMPIYHFSVGGTRVISLRIEHMNIPDAIRYIEFALQELRGKLSRQEGVDLEELGVE